MNAQATKTHSAPQNAQVKSAAPPAAQAAPPAAAQDHDGKQVLNAILEGKSISYTPTAEGQEIFLTVGLVQQHLCVPTRSGKLPGTSECVKFIMMCKARGLNPWTGDCYLLGYDTQAGPKFSLVVAIQALLKRAELARTLEGKTAFDGIDSGVIVEQKVITRSVDPDTEEEFETERFEVAERAGDLVMHGERLLGGWAKVFRNDRGRPFYQRLKLETYDKGTPIWKQDPAGMICKDSEAAALRQAFPSDLGGMFLASEIEAFAEATADKVEKARNPAGAVTLDTLSGRKPGQQVTQEAPQVQKTQDVPEAEVGSEAAQEGPDGVQDGTQAGEAGQEPGQIQEAAAEAQADEDPVSLEFELENWTRDISEATTSGRLDQLVGEAEQAHPQIKGKIMQAIGERRAALKKSSKGSKPGNLPGVG